MKYIICLTLLFVIAQTQITHTFTGHTDVSIVLLNKTTREYDFKIKSNSIVDVTVYKKNGDTPFRTRGKTVKYKVFKQGYASLIEVRSNIYDKPHIKLTEGEYLFDPEIKLIWMLQDDEEDDDYMSYYSSIVHLMISVVSMVMYVLATVRNDKLRYVLLVLLIIELYNGNIEVLADRFRKTTLRIK